MISLLEMENAMKRIPDYYEMPFFPNDIWGGQKGEDTVSAHKSKSGALVWVSRDDDGNLILKIIEDTEIIERFKSLLKKIEEERSDEECKIDLEKFKDGPHPMMPMNPEYDEFGEPFSHGGKPTKIG